MSKEIAHEMAIFQEDISVEPLEKELCSDCNENPPDREVWIDLRAIGTKASLGAYCGHCAIEMAERLKRVLPKYDPDVEELE